MASGFEHFAIAATDPYHLMAIFLSMAASWYDIHNRRSNLNRYQIILPTHSAESRAIAYATKHSPNPSRDQFGEGLFCMRLPCGRE